PLATRGRAEAIRASEGSNRPNLSSQSDSSSAPAPPPKRSESHSLAPSAADTSGGSRARSALGSSSTSAPRLTSTSLAQSAIPATPLHLEILREQRFVEFLSLDVRLLGVQQAAREFRESLFDVSGLVTFDPEVHHDFGKVAFVIQ